ncbi:MAG: hypothetical protein VYB37_13445, partial [Pseudomonadota bacterium]|nr:hypothetical protein [Pseudomonadota bacterium]
KILFTTAIIIVVLTLFRIRNQRMRATIQPESKESDTSGISSKWISYILLVVVLVVGAVFYFVN